MTRTAPDGSPVELYAKLGPMGEPELIHAAVQNGCEILELACGAGRITHRLLQLGHRVVAVDNSPAMLARVRGATTVLADIETLELGMRFPAVVLASHFVNDPDPDRRRRLLRTCARHVRRDGVVLVERLPPDWRPAAGEWSEQGGVRMRLAAVTTRGAVFDGVMEYELGGELVRHAFTSRLLADEELELDLMAAGLEWRRALGESSVWIEAVRPTPRR